MNSEALIKFLASLNPEQHDTLITLLKRCLPAQSRARPRDPGTQPTTVTAENVRLTAPLSLCSDTGHRLDVDNIRVGDLVLHLLFVTVCNCSPLKSLKAWAYFTATLSCTYDGGLCIPESSGLLSVQDSMLHIALFVKYEHEPFFINGSFINS